MPAAKILLALICTVSAGSLNICAGADPALAPTGTLRAAFLANNPVQGRIDKQTGEVTGPAVDLTRELGKRLGVPTSIVGVPGMRAMIDGFKNHTWDIAFLAFDPARAGEADFSQVYSLSWSSYIVPVNSPLHSVNDLDRAGIRIGAAVGDSPELFLSRTLKNAQVKRYNNPPADEVLRVLAAAEIDAYAANRQRLIEMAKKDPKTRVLPDNFYSVKQAIIVPKGNSAALAVINRFLDDARASGLIQQAIDRAGLKSAVDVAPPAKN